MVDEQLLSACELMKIAESSGATILDVRTDVEHHANHLAASHLQIPLHNLRADDLKARGINFDTPIIVLCQSGQRALKASAILRDAGYKNLFVVKGGLNACEAEGLECVRLSQNVMSLERQVRIVAGLLVLSGTILSIILSRPYFIAIPLFVGSGLIFAGITNWCGMGLLLARAPWNQFSKQEKP